MARIVTSLKMLFRQAGNGHKAGRIKGYKCEKHYMRGPGPACEKKNGSLQQNDGRDSRLVVEPSGLTRVSPDTLSAPRR